MITDAEWWVRVSKLTPNEAISEIRKANIDLINIDIEWEALISKQRYHYQNMCAAYEFCATLPLSMYIYLEP